MLGLAYYRATRCPRCGNDIRDCTAPEDQVSVHVPPPKRCLGSDALIAAAEEAKGNPTPQSLLFRAEIRRR